MIIVVFRTCDVPAEIENGNVEQARARQIKYIEDTPDPAIAIRERVDALKLMVNDRHFDERVQIAGVIIIDEDFEPSHDIISPFDDEIVRLVSSKQVVVEKFCK